MSAAVACPFTQVKYIVWGPRMQIRSCISCHRSPSLVRPWWGCLLARISEMIRFACLMTSRESDARCVISGVLIAMMAAASSARVDDGFCPSRGAHSWSAGWWFSMVWAKCVYCCSLAVGCWCLEGHQTPNDPRDHCGVRGWELPPSEKTLGVAATGPVCQRVLGHRMVSRSC